MLQPEHTQMWPAPKAHIHQYQFHQVTHIWTPHYLPGQNSGTASHMMRRTGLDLYIDVYPLSVAPHKWGCVRPHVRAKCWAVGYLYESDGGDKVCAPLRMDLRKFTKLINLLHYQLLVPSHTGLNQLPAATNTLAPIKHMVQAQHGTSDLNTWSLMGPSKTSQLDWGCCQHYTSSPCGRSHLAERCHFLSTANMLFRSLQFLIRQLLTATVFIYIISYIVLKLQIISPLSSRLKISLVFCAALFWFFVVPCVASFRSLVVPSIGRHLYIGGCRSKAQH